MIMDMPDLSHLTPEEQRQILSVMNRLGDPEPTDPVSASKKQQNLAKSTSNLHTATSTIVPLNTVNKKRKSDGPYSNNP